MNIAFVIDKIGFLDKFSIPILTAITKKAGHHTLVVEYSTHKNKTIQLLEKFKPQVIGFSVASNEAQTYLKINRDLKQQLSYFSIFGGPHPTFFPDFIKEMGVDGICRGEADIVLPKFLNKFGTSAMFRVPNFSFKKNGKIITNPMAPLIEDLDNLPFPDRDDIYRMNSVLALTPMKAFFAGRGCPFHCTYCFNHIFNELYRGKGKIIRTKSVSYLIREIKSVRAKYPMTFIKFHDDIFGLDYHWLEEFSERYPKEINLPFLCYTRANIIREDYIRLLKKSGCRSISLAIECGNEKLRNTVLKRNMSDDQIIKGCKIIKKYGIHLYTLNMVGLPDETKKDMFRTIALNRKIQVDFADASIFQPYPGTQITQYCIDKGYLDKNINAYESQFSKSILKYDEKFKNEIYITHKLFSILIDHPGFEKLIPLCFRLGKFPLMQRVFNLIYRFYYGYFLHKRIYGFKIPLHLNLWIAGNVLFSRNRT